ncbi:MAG TPA: hypothetical protein DCY00_05465, partial [Actinobacteria bacterium]|nr:hypothetical protein [Actinomycetota bacterium]
KIFLSSRTNDFLRTIDCAQDLRKEGIIVELGYNETDSKLEHLRDRKIDFCVIIDEKFLNVKITDIHTEKTFTTELKYLKDFLLNERNI